MNPYIIENEDKDFDKTQNEPIRQFNDEERQKLATLGISINMPEIIHHQYELDTINKTAEKILEFGKKQGYINKPNFTKAFKAKLRAKAMKVK